MSENVNEIQDARSVNASGSSDGSAAISSQDAGGSTEDQIDQSLPLQPSLDPQRPRSGKPGRFLLPSERQEPISRDQESDPEN